MALLTLYLYWYLYIYTLIKMKINGPICEKYSTTTISTMVPKKSLKIGTQHHIKFDIHSFFNH